MAAWSDTDRQFMNRAIQIARRGLYSTHPNPRVGCVLVKGGQIIGEGYHYKAGEGHAEINALKICEDAKGATCYVTLEPCCHQGKTPPCTEALIEAGVSKVIAAMQDPNPQVAGNGLATLQNAEIEIASGLCEEQAMGLNPGFIKRMQIGLPFIRCKIGASLDGRTAMASGESQWITSSESRQDVQRWRAMSSAIVTGIETVIADDPSLNVRDPDLDTAKRQPLRVVLDSEARFPENARMLDLPGDTLVMTTKATDRKGFISIDADKNQQVDLHKAMRILAKREVNEVLIEAGSRLSAAFIQAGLVDELILYLAPKLLGSDARSLLQLPGLEKLADCVQLDFKSIKKIGEDIRIVSRIIARNIANSRHTG